MLIILGGVKRVGTRVLLVQDRRGFALPFIYDVYNTCVCPPLDPAFLSQEHENVVCYGYFVVCRL